jgi:para-aminobenzoate synthetase component I
MNVSKIGDMMTLSEWRQNVNTLGNNGTPFLFIVDFEMKKPLVCTLEDADTLGLLYHVNGNTNAATNLTQKTSPIKFESFPMSELRFKKAFDDVQLQLQKGNTYLLNLTFPTPIETTLSLEEIFYRSKAPYRLLHPDFVVFSPECFVKIHNDAIFSYPMKGTIDASIPNAETIILQDKKELWEHNTIVDLLRNDLSIVSENVVVTKFRTISKITTHKNELLQVSSEIMGHLPQDWRRQLGDILLKLLPAGSISGAPKSKTVDIIRKAEGEDRGYYTGVFGVFDGHNLDSAVMIRYIEKTVEGYQFRSGGGITANSDFQSERQELIDKVYVPFV